MPKWLKRTIGFVALVLVVGGFYYALRERPVGVDVALVTSGPMQVSIKEEGETRVRDVYTVSSPMAGNLARISLDEGDDVTANETIVASIRPLGPPFLDTRTRRELQSAVTAAQSGVALAQVEFERSKMALQLAQSEFDRASALAKRKILPLSQLEKAFNALELQKAQVKSSEAAINLRKAELVSAEIRIQQPSDVNEPVNRQGCCVNVTAPINGVILNVLARSEQPVSPGTRIAEIGNPRELEVVVDLLSSDAAKIEIGAEVQLSEWGGSNILAGAVRRVDPAAFTKVSSLGIEEQRVNVVIDLKDAPPALGHGYRVVTNLVTWKENEVLQIPIGALFRSDGDWATFAVENGVAQTRRLKLGQMNDETAQVLSGVDRDESVILYPNDVLKDGSLIEAR